MIPDIGTLLFSARYDAEEFSDNRIIIFRRSPNKEQRDVILTKEEYSFLKLSLTTDKAIFKHVADEKLAKMQKEFTDKNKCF